MDRIAALTSVLWIQIAFTGVCQGTVYIQAMNDVKPRTLCPGDTLSYNCSLWKSTLNPRLHWHIRYPGQEPIVISYTDASFRWYEARHFGLSIVSYLRQYRTSPAPYIVSEITLLVMRNLPMYETEIKCTVDDINTSIMKIKHRVLDKAPLPPSGFRTIGHRINSKDIPITILKWDPPRDISQPRRPSHYDLHVSTMGKLLVWHNVSSPLHVALPAYVVSDVTLTAVNCFGTNSSSKNIQPESHGPDVYITSQNGSREHHILTVVLDEGSPPPSYSCSVRSIVLTTLQWSLEGGGNNFPSGVKADHQVVGDKKTSVLSWSRPLVFTDSGQYLCIASNENGNSTRRLDLLVKLPPTVSSLIAHDGTTFTSSSSALVRVGFKRDVLTCIGAGWPPPIAEWLRNDEYTLQQAHNKKNSPVVSTVLRFQDRFNGADAGDYKCRVRALDTDESHSKIIKLDPTTYQAVHVLPTACHVKSNTPHFTIRILSAECSAWVGKLEAEMLIVLRSAIVATCQECAVKFDSLVILDIECSRLVRRAVEIIGYITAGEIRESGPMFCALRRWQLTRPSIILNDLVYSVDSSLSIQ